MWPPPPSAWPTAASTPADPPPQQLPHTNDLTSLCLCHSALHRLTIPCIYSRFDIVWPDESTHNEPRAGVDALTYGLATLVMGDDCFPHQHRLRLQGQTPTSLLRTAANPYPVPQRRFGNYYGQFTKKFSLGNGPQAWVQEYMITKEGGKMLGTLVALAIARMVNLETFVWDMPTGVLRDVWLALSSLAHRSDGEECRLDRLWIRWHDNTIDAPVPPPAPPMILNNQTLPPPPNTVHPSGLGTVQAPVVVVPPYAPASLSALDRVEHPTFSVIPALKSLSVLDIDELPYLDEMSILIARSQAKLRELRIGIAAHAQQRDWVTVWEGEGLQQVDYSTTSTAACSIGEKRLGGVLGILVGRIHNMRHSEEPLSQKPGAAGITERSVEATPMKTTVSQPLPSIASLSLHEREADQDVDHFGNPMDDSSMTEGVSVFDNQPVGVEQAPHSAHPDKSNLKSHPMHSLHEQSTHEQDSLQHAAEPLLTGKLKLEVLELERVPLSVPVLRRAFDWSMLSTLTLLHCSNHEQLWKTLRRAYTPRPPYPGSPSSSKAYKASYTLRSEYQLNLKRIHTNTVSPSLISFLKETLAPNSLEVLFLQEGRSYSSTVTVDAIYKGPLKRHRASLKKLMIDSGEKGPDGHTTTSSRWRRWMLNREILTFITSGRMNSLRELAVSIDYKDWVCCVPSRLEGTQLTKSSTISSSVFRTSPTSAPCTSPSLPTMPTAATSIRVSSPTRFSTLCTCGRKSSSATWACPTSASRFWRTDHQTMTCVMTVCMLMAVALHTPRMIPCCRTMRAKPPRTTMKTAWTKAQHQTEVTTRKAMSATRQTPKATTNHSSKIHRKGRS